MAKGADTLQPLTAFLAGKAKAAGYFFWARYLKNLNPAEVAILSNAGLQIVSIWERGAGNLFNAQLGQSEALEAIEKAEALGQPKGSVIVFAVDFDAQTGDLSNIITYFINAEAAMLSAGYKLGAYGSGLVLSALKANRLITVAYLAGAEGWQGTAAFDEAGSWTIKQYPTTTDPDLGIEIDPCETNTDNFGGWMLSPVPQDQVELDVPTVLQLQRALNAHGAGLVEDSMWGARTAAALDRYYRDQQQPMPAG